MAKGRIRLGIDFGTTRTVVAWADRGNHPVVRFVDDDGSACDWFPSVVAERAGELRFGFDALALVDDPSAVVVRSFKRLLAGPEAVPGRVVRVGRVELPIADLVTQFLAALARAIVERSTLRDETKRGAQLEAVVATPANAGSAQRVVTLDAFRRAGFDVVAMLNEPSAAGFEFTHRHRTALTSRRDHVVVYDMGGGTFDASLLRMSGPHHDVLATAGVSRLGGDDFDAALADLALARAGIEAASVPEAARARLLDECRDAKERLNPSSRKIVLDLERALGDGAPSELVIPAAEFYAACEPLVSESVDAMAPLMRRMDAEAPATDAPGDDETEAVAVADPVALADDVAGVYVVGGASELPVIARVLRQRFGRRVHRSPYPSAAIAIGLSIAGDDRAGLVLSDRYTRVFGVFREGEAGQRITFDPIFTRDTMLPARAGAVVSRRTYRAAHNIGHFRFFECSAVGGDGEPRGEMALFGDVLFPFDARLREARGALGAVAVERVGDAGPRIEEEYTLDEHGIVAVTIRDADDGYERVYRLGA